MYRIKIITKAEPNKVNYFETIASAPNRELTLRRSTDPTDATLFYYEEDADRMISLIMEWFDCYRLVKAERCGESNYKTYRVKIKRGDENRYFVSFAPSPNDHDKITMYHNPNSYVATQFLYEEHADEIAALIMERWDAFRYAKSEVYTD